MLTPQQEEVRGETYWWGLVLWGSVLSSVAAIVARFLVVPVIKIILLTVFAITLKIITVAIFGKINEVGKQWRAPVMM